MDIKDLISDLEEIKEIFSHGESPVNTEIIHEAIEALRATEPLKSAPAAVNCECGAILPCSLTVAIEKFINQGDVIDGNIDISILEHALVEARKCRNCGKYYANSDFSS